MSTYKNPYVKLERLSCSVIDRILSISHSSVDDQAEEVTGRPSRSAKEKVKTYHIEDENSAHEVDESDSDRDSNYSNKSVVIEFKAYLKTKEENERQTKILKAAEITEKPSRSAKAAEITERPSRSAKQKVKTYIKDENSTHEVDESDSERDTNCSNKSNFEFNAYSKPKEKNEKRSKCVKAAEDTLTPSRPAKQKVKTYHIKDESSSHEVDESDSETDFNHSKKSDFEFKANLKAAEVTGRRLRWRKPAQGTGTPSRSAKQKVKSYNEDENSAHEVEESSPERDSNHSNKSEFEFNTYPKVCLFKVSSLQVAEATGTPSRSAKQKVKTYHIEDENSTHEVDESDSERVSHHSNKSDFEVDAYSKSEGKEKRQSVSKKLVSESDSNYSSESDVEFKPDSQSAGKRKRQRFSKKLASESDSTYSGESDVDFKPRRISAGKRKGQRFSKKLASESDSTYSGESDDDFKPRRIKRKYKKQKTEKVKELNEYEKLIQQNQKEKTDFLKSLKIDEVKKGFSEAVKSYKKVAKDHNEVAREQRTKKSRGPSKARCPVRWNAPYIPKGGTDTAHVPQPVPRQKIERSSKVYINLSEEAFEARNRSKAKELLKTHEEEKEVVNVPALLHLKNSLVSDRPYECFLHDMKDLDRGNTKPIDNYESGFQDMKLLESHIRIFKNDHISTMDFHPMRENTIIALGGKKGCLYLWNINSNVEPYAFDVHRERISHLQFNPENPHLIVCSSYDGSLREGDLVANVYKKVTKNTNCSCFDFLSPDTCLVGHTDGYVSVVDMRAEQNNNKSRQMNHQCHEYGVKSVSVHPVNKNRFITPTAKGRIRLWDLRYLKELPVLEVQEKNYNKSINSAIFSPLTGKSVLTSSSSGTICLFDTSKWKRTQPYSLKRPERCRASWQPRTDSNFAVGSAKYPRNLEIYNGRKKMFSYSHTREQSVISLCKYHPSLPLIATAQRTAVCVFSSKDL